MKRWLILACNATVLLEASSTVAQTAAADSRLTIVVSDSEGHPPENITVQIYQERPDGPARRVAELMTDAAGSLTAERLDPEGTYVVQFHGGAPIIVDSARVGSVPMQSIDDQNTGRELHVPDAIP